MALIDNVLGYWKFDVDSSTQVDSHASYDATVYDSAYTASGIINGGYTMDGGTTDYMDCADISPGGSALSIMCWFKTSDDSTWMSLLCKDDNDDERDYKIMKAGSAGSTWSDNSIFCIFNIGGVAKIVSSGSNTYNDGDWHQAIAVNDGTDLLLYVDGSLASSDGTGDGGSMSHNSYNVQFGASLTTTGTHRTNQTWDGSFDEFCIWSREVTSAEASSLWNSGSGFAYPFGGASGWSHGLNGIANANIAKVNGVAIADIAKINGS